MHAQQKVIVDWMREVMDRRDLSARSWAEKAKLGKDTVSRAIRPDYEHITTTTTIAKLAEAIGERPPGLAAAVPSADILCDILTVLHQGLLDTPYERDLLHPLAEALRDTLLHFADEPEAGVDARLSRALARVSMRQLKSQL